MSDLPTVRGLQPQLEATGINTVLVDVEAQHDLLDRLKFNATPTFILFDGNQNEIWRGNAPPTLEEIKIRLKL
jgi:hypothetical protein